MLCQWGNWQCSPGWCSVGLLCGRRGKMRERKGWDCQHQHLTRSNLTSDSMQPGNRYATSPSFAVLHCDSLRQNEFTNNISKTTIHYPRWRQSWGRVFSFSPPFVCVCFFCTASQKLMQLVSPNVTQKSSMMSPGNPFILGSKVKVTNHKNITGVGLYTLVSAGSF